MRNLLLAASLIAFGVGCGEQNENSSSKITEGVELGSSFSSIVKYYIDKEEGRFLCTGTFITRSLVLTAGHCVAGANSVEIATGYALGQSPDEIVIHPQYDDFRWYKTSQYDLALLKFDDEVTINFVPVSVQKALSGNVAKIIGFGNDDLIEKTGAGVKRLGFTIIGDIKNGRIYADGSSGNSELDWDDGESILGGGDSGGPMILFRNNFSEHLVGIASGGGKTDSFWVDLHSRTSKRFLSDHGYEY